ncbi:hypothetical protein [Paenibacillus sp. N3.4]|uniref:hypothetical protein n=1 Tax=Paenibacillus sp. N3.4 TaxID=2603222 RepID=UPI001C9C08BB|nr:hypothetical protein [Paenibacillus sp. N3.4]
MLPNWSKQSVVHLVVRVSLKLGLEAPLTADLPSPAVSKLYRNLLIFIICWCRVSGMGV